VSHIATLQLLIKDLSVLFSVARDLGLVVHEGQTTARFYGGAQHTGCVHALAVPHNKEAYEIGVMAVEGGYQLALDLFAGGKGLTALVGNGAHKLLQGYALATTMKTALRLRMQHGFNVKLQTTNAQGEIVLELEG